MTGSPPPDPAPAPLTEKQSEALYLRHGYKYTDARAAREMGIGRSAFNRLVNRAQAKWDAVQKSIPPSRRMTVEQYLNRHRTEG